MKLIFKQDNLYLQTFNSSVQTTSVWISRLNISMLGLALVAGSCGGFGGGRKKEEIKKRLDLMKSRRIS